MCYRIPLAAACVNGSDQHALVNAGGEKDVCKEVGEEERGALLYACGKVTVWIA